MLLYRITVDGCGGRWFIRRVEKEDNGQVIKPAMNQTLARNKEMQY